MKPALLTMTLILGLAASFADAQVSTTGQQSEDKSSKTQQIAISTKDRTYIPLVIDTTQTKPDNTTTRTESVEKGRLNDGGYFNWRDTVTTEHDFDPQHTEILQEVRESGRQGDTHLIQETKQDIETTPTGAASTETTYRRNNSGVMALDSVTHVTTTDDGNGVTTTSRQVQSADVNGNLHTAEQVQQTTVQVSPTESRTTSQVTRPDHMDGQLKVMERDLTTTQKSSDSTRSEETVQSRTAEGWTTTGKIVTTETRAADGSTTTETVQENLKPYADKTTSAINDLPQTARKIVEHEVRQPDGTYVTQRDVFIRDVNGDWKPQTFSTVLPTLSP